MASRTSSYKVKSAITDKREKKLLRVHRRSIDQREQRQDEMNKRRPLDNMSPVLESQDNSKDPSKAATPVAQKKAATSRLEMLKKWKEEKELKRKLEALEKARSRPAFRITHVAYEDHQVFKKDTLTAASGPHSKHQNKAGPKANTSATENSKPAAQTTTKAATVRASRTATHPSSSKPLESQMSNTKKQPEPTGRITRSKAANATSAMARATAAHRNSPAQKKLKPKQLPSKAKLASPRVRRNNFMAPTAASRMRAGAANATSKVSAKKEPEPIKVKDASKVQMQRGESVQSQSSEPSFAPSDFVFEAPSNISSFVFKPLSPTSVAGFLFPNGSSTSMTTFTDNVGRTSTPKRRRVSNTEQQNGSAEEPTTKHAGHKAAQPVSHPPPTTQLSGGQSLSKRVKEPDAEQQSLTEEEARGSPVLTRTTPELHVAGKVPSSSDSGIELTVADVEMTSELQVSTKKQKAGSDEEAKEICVETYAAEEPSKSEFEKGSKVTKIPASRRRSTRAGHGSISSESDSQQEGEQLPLTTGSAASKRRSTRRSIQPTEVVAQLTPSSVQPETTPARSHYSRRSSAAVAASDNQEQSEPVEVVQEENVSTVIEASQAAKQECEVLVPAKCKTPQRSRRSLRSSTAAAEDISDQTTVAKLEPVAEAPVEEMKNTHSQGRRRSRRSTVTSVDSGTTDNEPQLESVSGLRSTEVKRTPGKELRRSRRSSVAAPAMTPQEGLTDEAPALRRSTRQSRRSLAVQSAGINDPALGVEKMEIGDQSTSQPSTQAVENTDGRMKDISPLATRSKRSLQKGISKDDGFLTPGLPPSSHRKSTAKRRRTATMIALSSAKSPEEAIKIISNSPMVEMSRRTPKIKTPPDMNKSVNELFEDVDMILARPVRLFADAGDGQEIISSAEPETAPADKQEGLTPVHEEQAVSSEAKRDVAPFRALHSGEVEKLTALADKWTAIGESTPTLSEEVQGQIRTVACQARLLMAEKLNQFSGLVDKCEAGDPLTNCQDLQGFWDMVYIQAVDVYTKFEDLDKLQQNNWKVIEVKQPAQKMPAKKKTVVPKKDKPVGKSNFAAFRAQMIKQRKAQQEEKEEEKVFDAGFFKVSSPVRTPQYHCEAGTPKKAKTPTPEAASNSHGEKSAPTSSENKENLRETLLRRSIGGTPLRRSYVPAIPSPLLQDITPREEETSRPVRRSGSLRRSLMTSGGSEKAVNDGGDSEIVCEAKNTTPAMPTRKSTPRRRSTRARKSVSFAETETAKLMSPDTITDKTENDEPMLDMAYFQPSAPTSTSPLQASSLENSPFSCDSILLHSGKSSVDTTPAKPDSAISPQLRMSGRRKSALKKLPSAERRRSRRSVAFAVSPLNTSGGKFTLPCTPYNKNSLVAKRRVSRNSESSPGDQGLKATPQLRRSARPSLLYTPPQNEADKPKTPHKDIPVAELISLSP